MCPATGMFRHDDCAKRQPVCLANRLLDFSPCDYSKQK